MTKKSDSGAMLKYSRACSQEVVDQLSHITATQSIILGLQNSSSQSQSGHHFQQEVQDHLFRPKLKKMGTLQEQIQAPNLLKNSQIGGACLDVFTELSLVTEQEEAKTMRRSERYGNNRHQNAFKNTLQQKVIAAEESSKRANQQQAVAPQHFADALSPFTPIQQQQCVDDDGAGSCGYYNASQGAPVENFISASGQPCQQLLFNHHHHGYSEYNPRSRGDERNQDGDARRIGGGIGGTGPGSKGNQESAFNFRKQTLCEDEVMSREEDDVECVDGNDDLDDKDQNSCTEVDLMTNNRGGCDINNYFSGSSKANFGGGLNNQGTTPNKLLSNQLSSTVQVNSDQLMLPAVERTPLDYLSQQRLSAINGAASSSQRNAAEDGQLSEQFASTTIAERAGVANYEQVLEEVDNRFGEQYKIKALPAVKKPSQASFSVQHQKTQSNSTMGMLLSSPLFPVQLAVTNHKGDEDDESEEAAKLFGPSQMHKQRIQVGRLTSEEEDIHQQHLQDHQQLEQPEDYYGSKKPPSTEEDKREAALLYVFGGAQGRAEDSMLSEEYQPQVVVQIDPSMTPDVQPTPNNRTPKQQCSIQQKLKSSTLSGLSIGGNDNNKESTFPSIIIEESPRNTAHKDHQMLMGGGGGADDSKVVIQMMVSDGDDDDMGANSSSNDYYENEQDRASLLEDDYGEEEQDGEVNGPQESMLASLVIESITDDECHQEEIKEEEKDQVAQGINESEDDAMLAVGGSLGISSSYEDDEGDQASIGFLNHNQIDTSKILALQKMKNKKLKKRLSQKHQLDQTATLINERSQEVDDRQQALQYQYGFSVEQQKDNSSSRQGSTKKARQVIRFMHSSAVRNVGKHQSSQNISNLIAKSVIGVTPKIISKNVSRERLPNLPLSKVPFKATNSNIKHNLNNKNTSIKKQRLANKVGATGASSLQHHQLINFAEKAAGVISERNRKFSKPQTLKTLEQKLLHADDSDFDGVMDDEDYDEEEMDGADQVEVFKLELPEERHNADMQLQFNSEMISIDEFESRIEDEPQKFNHINRAGGDATVNNRANSSIGYTEVEQIADYIGVNVTSEVIDQVEATSPILQFRSQTMADISSPRQQHQHQQQQVSHFNNGARKSEETSTKPIRESMSSPNINSLKPNKVGVGQHNQHHQHLATSRNTMYDSTRPQNQTAGNSKQQQFHQRTSQKRLTLNGLLLNSHSGNPFSSGSAAANNRQAMVKKTSIKKSGSTSPSNRKYTNNYTNQQQQEPANKKGKMAAAQSMGRISTMSNHPANLKQHQSGVANNESQNAGTGARVTTAQIKDLIPYTQRIFESNNAAAGHLVPQQSQQNQQQTASTITTSWSKKPTPMLTGVSMASNSTATLPSHVYKKRSSKAQMAQIVCGNSTYKGPHHKRKASANKLIMDSSAQLHLVGATPTNSNGGGNQRYPRVGSQLQHSLNPNNLSAMNFGGVTSSQLNQHANGAPKTSQTTIATHFTNNSTNKAKQHVRSSQKMATTSISKRHSTKQQHSSQAAAHLSSGGSKLSIATFSGGKMKQPPPKQPTLITSPVTKVAPMMGADHQNTISLRVLQTPSGFTQQASSNSVVNSMAAANFKLSTISAQVGQSFKQDNKKVLLHKNAPEPSSSSAQKTSQNNNRLATVSSRKSVVSQTRSGKSLKSSMLSHKKMPLSSASKQDSNNAHHCASTGKKKQVHAQSESTMQIDREAYQKWNEEVEERDGFVRQNSEHFKEQWQFRQQSNYSARNHEKALKQLQQIKSGKQSIFEVVDDIMNSLQTPYGASRSPDIRSGGKDRSKIPKLTSGQPLLIEDDMEPQSVERSEQDCGGGSAHNTKHFYSSQKAMGPHQYATKGFETQHHCDTGRVRVKNILTTPLAGSNSLQLNTEMTQDSELRKPCGGNFRIEPVLPELGSPPEDEIAQPEKTFPTLESETDGNENAGQMNSGLTPYHALAVLKQKTPFRNKNRGGRNETTSVEVLMLDGTEFVSMSDTTPSQNVAKTTEEANKTAITSTKRVPLNTTFQYTVIQQPPPCDTDKDSIAPSLPESNSMPNQLTTAPIINENGPLSVATTERASTSRRMIATHGQVSATSLTSIGSKQPASQHQMTQKRSQQNIIEQISRQNDLNMPQRNIKRKQSKQIADTKGGSFLSNILGSGSGGGPQTTTSNTHQGGVISASSTPVYKHHVGVSSQKITGRKETTTMANNQSKPNQQYYQQKKSKKVAAATRKNGLVTGHKSTTNTTIQQHQNQYQAQQQLKVKQQSTFNNSMTNNTSMSGEPTQQSSLQQYQKHKQTTYLAIPGASIQRPVTTTQTLSSGKRSVGGGMATGSSVKHMAPGGSTIKMMKYSGGLQHHHTSCQSARGHQSSRGSVAHVAPQIILETGGANHRSVSIGSNQNNHQQQNSRKPLSPQPTLKIAANNNIPLNNNFAKKVSLDLGGSSSSCSAVKPFRLKTGNAKHNVHHVRNDSGEVKEFQMLPNISRSLLISQQQSQQSLATKNLREDQRSQE